MGLEHLVIAVSLLFNVGHFLAWHWARSVQRDLRGRYGYELVRIVAMLIGWSLAIRVAGLGVIAVVGLDRQNFDQMLSLTLVLQMATAALFIWSAFKIRALQRPDGDLDTTGSEPPSELGEGVGVEIDQVGPDGTVAVDEPNGHAVAG